MFADHNGTVRDMLLAGNLVGEELLEKVESARREADWSLATAVIEAGLIARPEVLSAMAAYLDYPYIGTLPPTIAPELAANIPPALAHRHGVVPVDDSEERIRVVALDPLNAHLGDDLGFSLQREIEIAVGDPEAIAVLLEATYGSAGHETLETILAELAPVIVDEEREHSPAELTEYASDTPIIRLVDTILARAVRERASDIHFEPYEDVFRVRYRIDGMLHEMPPPPRSLALPVASRLKVLADLDIAERRLPQDGRIRTTIAGRAIDMRVSTLPTQFGESVVLRVLDKSVAALKLDQLRMPADILAGVREVARRPNGVFIVTGPTGSGKTTTLYSALREVNDEDTKILTAEDPVEYEVEGLVQTAINPAVGLTFASVLRSFLRQDPDKLLVGEIRDLETARVAAQAALTGHLVFTTLHTNDAIGTVDRLVDIGLERFLIAASLEAVLAQRLVRRVCPRCRVDHSPTDEELRALNLTHADLDGGHFAAGRGCTQCHRTGYAGRLGLFEMMMVNDAFRDLVSAGSPASELRAMATKHGMRTLRANGIQTLLRGETTVDEVLRHT